MGLWNPRAFCPNCGAKIHTHDSSLIPGTRRTGTECPNCGAKLSGKVGLGDKAVLAGQKSDGEQVAALIGKGISAGGRAVKKRHDQRRVRKATGSELSEPAEFQKMVTVDVSDSSRLFVQPTMKNVRLSFALL